MEPHPTLTWSKPTLADHAGFLKLLPLRHSLLPLTSLTSLTLPHLPHPPSPSLTQLHKLITADSSTTFNQTTLHLY